MSRSTSRRSFLQSVGLGTAALGLGGVAQAQAREKKKKTIQGFEEAPVDRQASPDVVKLLKYVTGLAERSENRVLSGQHCGRGVEVAEQYRTDVTEVAAATGHKIALIGSLICSIQA